MVTRMTSMRRAGACLALGAWSAVGGAAASPLDPARVAEANAAAASGRCDEAITAWRAVTETAEDRALLVGNIGHCLDVLGRPVEAIEAFREARRLISTGAAPRDDDRGDRLSRLDARLAALSRRVGWLTVRCDAAGRVAVDERPPVACPLSLAVDPGVHRVVVSTPGEAPGAAREVRVDAGETVELGREDEGEGDVGWPWIAGGVALGVAVVAGALVIASAESEPAPRVRLVVEE